MNTQNVGRTLLTTSCDDDRVPETVKQLPLVGVFHLGHDIVRTEVNVDFILPIVPADIGQRAIKELFVDLEVVSSGLEHAWHGRVCDEQRYAEGLCGWRHG